MSGWRSGCGREHKDLRIPFIPSDEDAIDALAEVLSIVLKPVGVQ
jgi:hypothetical protein